MRTPLSVLLYLAPVTVALAALGAPVARAAPAVADPALSIDAQPAPSAAMDTARWHEQVQTFLTEALEPLRGADGEAPEIQVGAVRQGALPPCDDLVPFLPPGTRLRGSMNVGVRCTTPTTWTAYVPVSVRMSVTYLVAARAIATDQAIGPDDLAVRSVDFSRVPPNVAREPDAVIGQVAGNRIGAGQPVKTAALRSSEAVLRGQRVRVTANGPGFSVSSEGQALATAVPGAPVQVRTASGQTITAIVLGAGRVEVPL